ncbi:MAG TPA: threonine--tRNA ligase [Acidimicrobiales bacterium]|nr:threonine--tRNA ligase [Acidimicrobiales bacterium]
MTITLPDGAAVQLPSGSTYADLAASIGPRLAKAVVAAERDGHPVDLGASLVDGSSVRLLTPDSPGGRDVLRHSTAHVLAQAVLRLWPGAHYAIGPVIAGGFYYDFELPDEARFSDDDLDRIDATMREIIAEEQPFERHEHTVAGGLELFADQPFKVEIIEKVAQGADEVGAGADDGVVTSYRNTDAFTDLCRGPHVPSTGRLGHFRLQRVAGAYWRGDEHRPQLQRIYGTAFESEAALAEHLEHLEEAERRDHRKLGAELDLFSFPEEIGPGLAIFHAKGGLLRKVIEDYSRQRHLDAGYQFVTSPHITKRELFDTSGHLSWFAESMYPPMELDEGQEYYLKPMNCPFHMLVFKSRQRSYRDMPQRYFEFGTVYRYERSGVVHGLTRVRGMTMDDAHLLCRRDQMHGELTRTLEFVLDMLRAFGLSEFYLELSTRPEGKAVGTDEEWQEAESTLLDVATASGLELHDDPGGGAFYGPKISVQARDAIGRTHQLSTVQLDFQTPQRFDVAYIGADNGRHRPIMIHRALFGSVERFLAILLEHYAGNLPTWLMPEQFRVLPVRDDHHEYAAHVAAQLHERGLRGTWDEASEPLGGRIRKAKLDKLPYVLVVGDDDVANSTVGVNRRGSADPERGVAVHALADEMDAQVVAHGAPETTAG